MALAVDSSSPTRATTQNNPSVTTVAFNPPACLLLVAACADAPAGQSPTLTLSNNGTALTWTNINLRNASDAGGGNGVVGFWYAYLPSARTGMTITASYSISNDISIKVYCLTGAAPSSPVGGQNEGTSTTNNLTTTGFTVAQTGSLGFVAANDWNALGTPTSSDTTFTGYDVPTQASGGSGYKTLGAAGSSATFNVDAPGSGAAAWNWCSVEIKAAADATTGTISATAPTAQATMAGIVIAEGQIGAAAPLPQALLFGANPIEGTLHAVAPLPAAAFTASPPSLVHLLPWHGTPAESGQIRRVSTRWRVLVADTRTGQILTELPYTALNWSDTLDFTRTSSLTVTVPLESDADVHRVRSLVRGAWRYTLLALYGGRPVIGGPLLTHKIDPAATTAELGCGGPASLIASRLVTRVNFMPNASFEDGITGWDVIGPTGSTKTQVTQSIPPTEPAPPHGDSYLRVTSGGTTGTLALVSPRVPITAGLPYTVSAYLRNSALAQSASGFILWYSTPTGLPWEWDSFTYRDWGDVSGGWARKSITATAPAGAVALAVQAQAPAGTAGHTLDADAVLVEHTTAMNSYNLATGEVAIGPVSLPEIARRMLLLATLKAGSTPGAELPIILPEVNPDGEHVRTYQMNEVATIAERLGQLTQVENGPDVHLRPILTPDGRHFLWDARIGEPRIGHDVGWTWTYGANCSAIGVDSDAAAMTMRAFVPGQASTDPTSGANTTPVGSAEDLSLLDVGWPLLERADTARSTTETTVNLDAQAEDFLRTHGRPIEAWQVTARADMHPPLGQWLLGDAALLRIRGHRWIEDGDYPRRLLSVSGDATDEITLGVTSGEGRV